MIPVLVNSLMKTLFVFAIGLLVLSSEAAAQINVALPQRGGMRVHQGLIMTRVRYNSSSRWDRFFNSWDSNGPGRQALLTDLGTQFLTILPGLITVSAPDGDSLSDSTQLDEDLSVIRSGNQNRSRSVAGLRESSASLSNHSATVAESSSTSNVQQPGQSGSNVVPGTDPPIILNDGEVFLRFLDR